MRWLLGTVMIAAAVALAPACGDDSVTPDPEPVVVTPPAFGEPYDKLSDWHLFADPLLQLPAERVVPYDVIAPLFSDYTSKWRFLFVPEGETVPYADDGAWEFPVGSVLVKTFAYADDVREPEGPRRILETRLLWREPEGWTAHTYIWNEEQSEAIREVGGRFVDVTFIDPLGATVETAYRVPNTNECADCHHQGEDEAGEIIVGLLGPKTSQLDRDHDYGAGPVNQLDHLASLGLLSGEATPFEERGRLVDPYDAAEDLSLRARSYLDANCSGCHRQGGSATGSDLELDFASTDPETSDPVVWGVCKIPTSAGGATCGNSFDIVPGEPDLSILVCRMTATELDQRMPPLGSKIVHEEGLALMREWIESLPPASCTP